MAIINVCDVFLKKMARVVADSQWLYQGNQLNKRAGHLGRAEMHRLVELIEEVENEEPQKSPA